MITVPDMIAKIEKPVIREMMEALYKDVGPVLTKTEDDIIKNMEMFGAPSPAEADAIREMVRVQGFKALLEKLKEEVDKHIEKRKAEKGVEP